MRLNCDTVRSWASPAGGEVELRGSAESLTGIAQVVVAADGRVISTAELRDAEIGGSGQRFRWTAMIPAAMLRESSDRLRIVARDERGNTVTSTLDEQPRVPGDQPWSIDEYRLALASGRHLMVCHRPAFDGSAMVADLLVVEGWSYDPAGAVECSAWLDDAPAVPAVHGLPTPHLPQQLGDWPGLDTAGFRVLLDTSGWPVGMRRLAVMSRSTHGSAVSWGTRVRIDPNRAYRRWLIHRRTASPLRLPPGSESAPQLLIWPLTATPRLLRSLREQAYPWWSVAGSHESGLRGGLQAAAVSDATLAVFISGGAELRAGALSALAAASLREVSSAAFFADHDRYDALGRRAQPWFKAAWSPEHLLEIDYVGPLLALRPPAARAVLADRSEVTSLYDLALRLVASDLPVAHVSSIAATIEYGAVRADPLDARVAIERLARRRGRDVAIVQADESRRRVSWPPAESPLVTVVIPTGGQHDMIVRCLDSIVRRSSYPRIEIVVVDTSRSGLSRKTISTASPGATVVRQEGSFNFSVACNLGAAQASGEVLVFLNDDTVVDTSQWIERLLDHALTEGVAPVGAKLLYPDRSIQHGGTLIRLPDGGVLHMLHRLGEHAPGPHGVFGVVRNCSAVTAACLMISRREFASLGGFDEDFVLEYGDVDLCLRALAAGRRVVYTPHAVLVHHESASRGSRTRVADWDLLKRRWSAEFAAGDSYYSPDLDPYGWFVRE
jgi:O-antigen biosynthesis protein